MLYGTMDHVIVEGDSLKYLDNLDEKSIHLAITDPPYFTHFTDNNWEIESRKWVGLKFDRKQGINLQKFINIASEKIIKCLYPGSFFIVFSDSRLSHRMAVGVEDAGFEIRDIIAWKFEKSPWEGFSLSHFVDGQPFLSLEEKNHLKEELKTFKTPKLASCHDNIIMAQKPKEKSFIHNWVQYKTGLINLSLDVSSVIEFSKKVEKNAFNTHPTIKPVKLIEYLIEIFSRPGQMVLDPFLGSGTTSVAAKNTDRKSIGIEINPNYVKIAKQRLKEGD